LLAFRATQFFNYNTVQKTLTNH